jgi:hypothetical protein
MGESDIRSTLTIPLYWTFHLEDISGFEGLSERELREFQEGHGAEEISAVVEALAWATDHPEAEFASFLPGLPHSNEELWRYLGVLHAQLTGEG